MKVISMVTREDGKKHTLRRHADENKQNEREGMNDSVSERVSQ